jgi:Cu(I)/Ag(I) efflux system membrane fusion protein
MFATVTLTAPLSEAPGLTAGPQAVCPVTALKLGAMGDSVAVDVGGRKVWVCCEACAPRLRAQPARYLSRLAPAPRGEVLSVPESAVIDTGTRTVVYVETGPGVFEGRAVVLGPRVGDRFPVLDGLSAGEQVAARGAFLIDAESRINPGAAEVAPPTADRRPPARSAAATQEGVQRQ